MRARAQGVRVAKEFGTLASMDTPIAYRLSYSRLPNPLFNNTHHSE